MQNIKLWKELNLYHVWTVLSGETVYIYVYISHMPSRSVFVFFSSFIYFFSHTCKRCSRILRCLARHLSRIVSDSKLVAECEKCVLRLYPMYLCNKANQPEWATENIQIERRNRCARFCHAIKSNELPPGSYFVNWSIAEIAYHQQNEIMHAMNLIDKTETQTQPSKESGMFRINLSLGCEEKIPIHWLFGLKISRSH